jgi:hypothetical protein
MATSNQKTDGFVLDDLTFDLLTIVQKKSRALEAYCKYLGDTNRDPEIARLVEQVKADDERHIQMLLPHLAKAIGRQPSQTAQASQQGSQTQGNQAQRNGNRTV